MIPKWLYLLLERNIKTNCKGRCYMPMSVYNHIKMLLYTRNIDTSIDMINYTYNSYLLKYDEL